MTDAAPFWYLRAPGTEKASDWHLTVGEPLRARIHGDVRAFEGLVAADDLTRLEQAAPLIDDELELQTGAGTMRYRVHRFTARGRACAVIRSIPPDAPTLDSIAGLPLGYRKLIERRKGLILVGGATGSGKSTTVAASIDKLNKLGGRVIRTLEDPIEFIHHATKDTVIYQGAYGRDFHDWADAITSGMREDPDVFYVGEMRDPKTIAATLRAAETGHLVFATVHGGSPASMIDRIISAHQGAARETIAALLASICIGFLAQDLVAARAGGRVAIFELLLTTTATAHTIRDNRIHQITSSIASGGADGMVTFDTHIERLLATRVITVETAQKYHSKPSSLNT